MRQVIRIQLVHHPVEGQLTVIEVPFRQQTLGQLQQQFVPGQNVRVALDGIEVVSDAPIPSGATVLFALAAAKPAAAVAGAAWFGYTTFAAFAYAMAFNIAVAWGLSYLGGLLFGPDMSSPREAITGNAFAWNPQTTQQEGIPLSMSWGTNMHYGNIIARWTDVIDDDEMLYIILDYGGGPIQGRGANPLFINGRASGDYSGVTIQDRLGTLNQTCMTGFEKTKLEYGLSWSVKHDDGPITFTTPNKFFDDIEWTLAFPKGLWYFHKDGDFSGNSATVKVEVQEVPLGGWVEVFNEAINGSVMKAIYKAYSVNTESPGTVTYGHQYDIKITLVSDDQDTRSVCNVMNLRSVREVVDTAFTHPGRALLGISALATEDLSQHLNAKWIADDKLVNIYNGTTWSIGFTRNRAWIDYDALTQPVISGDGNGGGPFTIERYDGVDPSMIDTAFFFEWAEWCADDVTDGHGGTEDRMTCDHTLDYQSSVWDFTYELAQVGRCSLYWQGSTLTGWVDKAVAAADYIDLVTFDNIMLRSWKSAYSGYGERAGNVEVFYRDALQGYERKPLPRSNEEAGLYTRIITVEGIGVTGHALAARVANHALQRNRLIKNVDSVRMYKDALRYRLGDVVHLQSKVPNWGTHYRVIQSEANNTVDLDRVCDAEVDDIIFVRSYDETNKKVVIKSYTVASVVAKVVTITTTWDVTPVKDNLLAIGVAGKVKTRRIIKMTQTVQNYFDVEFETYDATLFDSDAINPNFNNPDYVWAQPAAALTDPATKQDVLAMIGELLQFQPDIDSPHTSNCTWTGSGGDTVTWSKTDADHDIHFRYRGVSYAITPDSTTDEFIYWDPNFTTVFRTTNNAAVALAPTMWLVCTNKAGVAHPATPMQLLHAGVILAGTIRASMYLELRNTYVYNAEDSLDSSKPFEVRFKIVSEMIAIISIKLSFSLMPYRAYSTAASSGGGTTSGGGSTWPWGRTGAEDPGDTNDASAGNTTAEDPGDTYAEDGADNYTQYEDGTGSHRHSLWGTSHNHTMPTHYHGMYGTHKHTMPTHDHLINAPDHTHDTPNHGHGITYGMHEEDNAPVTFHYHIHNGVAWGDPSGNYSADETDIDISGLITGTGWKAVRFDTDKRCRIAAIIECKLDINA